MADLMEQPSVPATDEPEPMGRGKTPAGGNPNLLEDKFRPARFATKVPEAIEACSKRDVSAPRELAESPGGLVTNECRRDACGLA